MKAWSHSALKDFEGCARRYHEVRVLKNYVQKPTEQIRYGKELHKAAEDYVKDNTPIPRSSRLCSLRLMRCLQNRGLSTLSMRWD